MTPLPDPKTLEARKAQARAWFESLRDEICRGARSARRRIAAGRAECGSRTAGRFVRTPWERKDHTGTAGGGGVMSIMKGRVFEKVGVHVSTVFGEFAPEFRKEIPGADADPRFWASGISLIAHPWNPNVPAVHMNTRFVVTTKAWFGGGADLTPVLDKRRTPGRPRHDGFPRGDESAPATRMRPSRRMTNTSHGATSISILKHRNEPRGIGGIFYDWHNSGDWDADFAFTQSVGREFLAIYPQLVRRNFTLSLWRGRTRGTARAARALCGIQPALRPRHDFRFAHRRQCRFHPVVAAAGSEMAVS